MDVGGNVDDDSSAGSVEEASKQADGQLGDMFGPFGGFRHSLACAQSP